MEYYKEIIDIEKTNLEDINVNKLLTISFPGLNGVSLSMAIEQILEEKGYPKGERTSEISYKIVNKFNEFYPACNRKVKEIMEKYKIIFKELPEKYNVQQYTDDNGWVGTSSFFSTEEKELLEKYENARKIQEKKEGVEIHNIVLDSLNRIEEKFDSLFNLVCGDIQEQNKEAKMAILKNKYVWTGIILCVIFIFVFWETWGPLTILIAPIGVLVLAIAVGLYNAGGRYRYGSKWDSMTPYEQGTQVKKDNFINSLNNKK